jgi:O-phosphoseryl-tRNA(Cys) synthetase
MEATAHPQKIAYLFNEAGHCENPALEFSFSGKYIAVKITSAAVEAGYVFGTYFRGVYSYAAELCKNTATPVPAANKKQQLAKLLQAGISFFEGIKASEISAIVDSRWHGSSEEMQSTYDKEIGEIRKKLSDCLQLSIF